MFAKRLWSFSVTAAILSCILLATPLRPVQAESAHSGDVYWGQEPVVELSATRGRQVLNGIWRFMPATGASLDEPQGGWGAVRVPGAWHRDGWAAPLLDGVVVKGASAPWGAVPLAELARAWYEREIAVPQEWAGREIVLALERVSTDAVVYVDGKQCGSVSWPRGEVVLTDHVEAGQTALLRILVLSAPKADEVPALIEGSQTTATCDASSFSRGLVGDVILKSRPKGSRIAGVFVKTSVQRKELALDIDLTEVSSAGAASFTATVKDAQGRVVKTFTSSAALTADAEQTVHLSWGWEDPALWDFQQPNLYTVLLRVDAPGLSDEYAQQFGFREFRIEGKQFLLNEKPFRLRPTVDKMIWNGVGMREAIENQLDSMVEAGFNLVEIWPSDDRQRGLAVYRELMAEVADQKGVPIMYPATDPRGIVGASGGSSEWKTWEEIMVEDWKRVRNHPSIVTFVCTANAFQHADDQNPRRVGNREALLADSGDGRLKQMLTAGFKTMDVIRKYETTRPVAAHHGSAVGDFHMCNVYLDMIPLQEREEWLSEWAQSDNAGPFMAVEFGTPWLATMHRGRANGSQARTSEPFLTEYCAIYMGSDAYRQETDAYRKLIPEKFAGGQSYDIWGTTESPDYKYLPNYVKLQAMFIRNTWRSWRTWGISGGMLPWDQGYGWKPHNPVISVKLPAFEPGRVGAYITEKAFETAGSFKDAAAFYLGLKGCSTTEAGEALVESNAPTLAWIAGPEDAFTAKDHHFFPGTTVRKQAVLINDLRAEQPFEVSWSVKVGGQEVASGQDSGTIGVAQNLFIPIEFDTPGATQKTDGAISLTARIGDAEHSDTFAFRVFPRPEAPPAGTGEVLAFDPEGHTTALLEELGWRTKPWDGAQAPGRVLVIGRGALSGGEQPPGSLQEFVAHAGRLVVFAQDPDWLRQNAGFRVAHCVARRFYPVPTQASHPIVANLDADDLRDWCGSGTLIPATANDNLDKDFSDWRALNEARTYGWHWGNRGSVSSAPIEKPHRSGWRPILEGEFDLAYSPLMELNYGQGLAIWCTLDVEGRDQPDPVAHTIVSRMLTYAARAPIEIRAPRTVYMGGQDGEDLLKELGVPYQKAAAVPRNAVLLVVGPKCRVDDKQVATFMAAGGKVFFMARDEGKLPLRYVAKANGGYHGSGKLPRWPEFRGLSESDLHLRTDVHVPVLVAGPGQGGAEGLFGRCFVNRGVALFMQLLPHMLNAEEKTYLRFSQWRLTRAVSQILSNMGAEFEADGKGLACLQGQGADGPDYYCPGYRTDFELGDDPYRYKRW